jgi:cyanophycin synthetase
MPDAADIVELRVLDGPNLYFTRPAIKLTLAVPGWLRATEARLAHLATEIDLPGRPRPGARESEQRRRFTARVGAHVTRSVARRSSVRLAVRGRTGPLDDQIVVAFPWRRRDSAEALAHQVAAVMRDMIGTRRSLARLVTDAADAIAAVDPGPAPTVTDPVVPVIAVTGTNGKTTTVRLLAHLVRSSGCSVAYSSTDGVFRDGALVEDGDYSGFAGAQMALGQPDIDVAILETARGGILLRGIGTTHNDVAVVTNVSADHLGLHGVDCGGPDRGQTTFVPRAADRLVAGRRADRDRHGRGGHGRDRPRPRRDGAPGASGAAGRTSGAARGTPGRDRDGG